MAITKIQSESLNLADDFAFTGTITGAGGTNTPNFLVYQNANLSIDSNVETKVNFNSVLYDTASGFNTSTYIYTIPSGQGGKWFLNLKLRKNNFSGNSFRAIIKVNDSTYLEWDNSSNGDAFTTTNGSIVKNFSAGDYFVCYVKHNDSGTRQVFSGVNDSFFFGYKIIE